jgi:hypothetical protein
VVHPYVSEEKMRSRTLGLILVIATAVSLAGLLLFVSGGGFGGRGYSMAAEIPRSFWLVLFVAPLFIVVTGVVYTLVFPEISEKRPVVKDSYLPAVEQQEPAIAAVLRVLSEEERKVIEAVVAEGGMMLQKDIRWKTGLSRVKTHRILYRLAEREIVSVEKYYNTNKITLADWLVKEARSPDNAGQGRGAHT